MCTALAARAVRRPLVMRSASSRLMNCPMCASWNVLSIVASSAKRQKASITTPHPSRSSMNGRSAGSSAHHNHAARRVVVVAQVAAVVDKAEAVLVDMVARVVDAQAAQVVVVQVVRVVASAVRLRAQRPGSQPRCPNKTPLLMAHGVCGSG